MEAQEEQHLPAVLTSERLVYMLPCSWPDIPKSMLFELSCSRLHGEGDMSLS